MLELNFLVFCITIIALVAIVFGKDEIVGQALSALSEVNRAIVDLVHRQPPDRRG